ncbi:MAG: hypothetical protein RSA01_09025 [Clostridium sp.]
MNLIKRFVLSLTVIVMLAFFIGSDARAFVSIPEEVRAGTSKYVLDRHSSFLAYDNPNITKDEAAKGFKLGRGIEIKDISYEDITSGNKSLDDTFYKGNGPMYLFFATLNGKYIEPFITYKNGNNYSAGVASVNPKLEGIIESGFKTIEGSGKFTSRDAVLVDFGSNEYALYSKKDGKIVMITNQTMMGYKANDIIGFKDIHSKMLSTYVSSVETVDTSVSDNKKTSTSYMIVCGAIVLMFGFVFYITRNKDNN